jgi:hypothetical protein
MSTTPICGEYPSPLRGEEKAKTNVKKLWKSCAKVCGKVVRPFTCEKAVITLQ